MSSKLVPSPPKIPNLEKRINGNAALSLGTERQYFYAPEKTREQILALAKKNLEDRNLRKEVLELRKLILPKFEGQDVVREQLEVYMLIQAVRGELNRVLAEHLFGAQGSPIKAASRKIGWWARFTGEEKTLARLERSYNLAEREERLYAEIGTIHDKTAKILDLYKKAEVLGHRNGSESQRSNAAFLREIINILIDDVNQIAVAIQFMSLQSEDHLSMAGAFNSLMDDIASMDVESAITRAAAIEAEKTDDERLREKIEAAALEAEAEAARSQVIEGGEEVDLSSDN